MRISKDERKLHIFKMCGDAPMTAWLRRAKRRQFLRKLLPWNWFKKPRYEWYKEMNEMRISDAVWSSNGTWLLIVCGCGERFKHRADRWNVRCPTCGSSEHLSGLRKSYLKQSMPSDNSSSSN